VKAKAPIQKKFYQQLAHEERGHLLIFQDMHEYFTGPVYWFSEKEKLHWDGGIEVSLDERGNVL
jgi:hypothetical protein